MASKKPFNNPFAGLKLEKVPPKPKVAPAPRQPPPPPAREEDDAALFRRLFEDVEPVRGGPEVIAPAGPSRAEKWRVIAEDEEVLDTLHELVAGAGPFDLADSDEFIEGSVADLDKRILRRLRRGDYSYQAHLDLHGLTRAEAKEALFEFVEGSRRRGHRCVLVVHGRGLHSKDQVPVLKEGVEGWLSRGRLASQVLAFSSARPHDGGAGAVYVLLRR